MAWPKRQPRRRRRAGSPLIIRPDALPFGEQGTLVGPIGISCEGVTRHDIITESAIACEAGEEIRTDGVEFRGTTLPDMNEQRNPRRF
jgi:hypothetical protein